MKMKFFNYILLFIFLSNNVKAQELNQIKFDSVLNQKTVLYFDNLNKKYFGCGMNIDCMGLPVVFTNIYLTKLNNELTISGYVNPMTTSRGDTIGTNVFKIFVAQPYKGKLKKIRTLIDVNNQIMEKSSNSSVNIRLFKFQSSFRFKKKDCLYIESTGLYRLKEYKIGLLLRM
jgi:hypothetical protein